MSELKRLMTAVHTLKLPFPKVTRGNLFPVKLNQGTAAQHIAWWVKLILIPLAIPLLILLFVIIIPVFVIALLVPSVRRKFRAWRMDRKHPVEIEIDTLFATPGGVVTGSLVHAHTPSLVSWALRLVMTESATYQQGTDRRTETHTDVIETILQGGPVDGARQGSPWRVDFTLNLPPDIMHSFEAGNNSIKWYFQVERTYPDLPETKANLHLPIYPPSVLPEWLGPIDSSRMREVVS